MADLMNDKLVEKCLQDAPYKSVYEKGVLTRAIPIIRQAVEEDAYFRGFGNGETQARLAVAEEIKEWIRQWFCDELDKHRNQKLHEHLTETYEHLVMHKSWHELGKPSGRIG